jgi:hypothetical protein
MSRTFNPTLQVIAAQPALLKVPDLSIEAILNHFPGLAEAESVCITGSTAAGWANTFSDIDIYAFSDEELGLPADETTEMWTSPDRKARRLQRWIGAYGDSRVDLAVWRTDALRTVLAPFVQKEVEFCAIEKQLQDFVYRVSIGVPIKNEDYFAGLIELLRSSSYHRALARWQKAMAENALTDVAGQLDSGDYLTARLSAVNAAETVTDACLLLSGELCRGTKWLLRRLESKPECGITVDEYCSVVLDGLRPGETNCDYARRVARWAQAQIVRLEDAFLAAPLSANAG